MLRVNVGGSYEDFKRVAGGLGKTAVVFWARENPTRVNIWAVLEGVYVVHANVEAASSVSSGSFGAPSPLAPAPVAAHDEPDAPAKPADPNAKPAVPKTILETDFPGAIELPGGAVVFS